MNKILKVIIGLLITVIICCGIIDFVYSNKLSYNKISVQPNIKHTSDKEEIKRAIMVDGKVYYDTGKESTGLRCGTLDGKIEENIPNTEIPYKDNQSNFKGTYGYQYTQANCIEVLIDGKWIIFKTDLHTFSGVIKEVGKNYILVEPNKDEEERKSSDLISVNMQDNEDIVYEVGKNVKITYSGFIMETYPAKIEVIKIELKSADEFTIKVYDKSPKTNEKVHAILTKEENDKYDYNIYAYCANVNIVIKGEEISLRQALLENKITMDEIIEKANSDITNPVMYRDGGSIEYHYDLYTIIKVHKLDGNRDVYIGMPGLNLNTVIEK